MMRPNILLVDETGYLKEIMQQYLENENYCVVSSATVSQALTCIAAQTFDVLVTDLKTRTTQDGFCLATAIRHLQPDALIVAVCESLDAQLAVRAIQMEVDVIVRPFDVKEVGALINSRIKGEERLSNIRRQHAEQDRKLA
jgi:DNA-binding NtrC family response regulator